jgi:polysaccharide pyruvyl transferase WcaK-like protein
MNIYQVIKRWIRRQLWSVEEIYVDFLEWLILKKHCRDLKKSAPSNDNAVLIVPPAEPCSLGDEAMMAALTQQLTANNFTKIIALNAKQSARWSSSVPAIQEEASYADFSHLRRRINAIKKILLVSKGVKYCIFIGADILDGGYGDWHVRSKSELACVLARAGILCRIAGFSYNSTPSKDSIRLLAGLPHSVSFFPRDPLSFKRFSHYTQRNTFRTADLAFAYQAPGSANPKITDIEDWARGKKLIGIAPNALLYRFIDAADFETLCNKTCDIVSSILQLNKNNYICLIAHDRRVVESDIEDSDYNLCNYVAAQLDEKWGDRLRNFGVPDSAEEVSHICEHLNFAISGRMHFAIACLRSYVPVMCAEYQDKVTGLMGRHLDLEELVFDVNMFNETEKLIELIDVQLSRSEEIKSKLRKKTPSLVELAKVSVPYCSNLNDFNDC